VAGRLISGATRWCDVEGKALGNVVSDPRSRKATSEWYPPSLANFRNAPKAALRGARIH